MSLRSRSTCGWVEFFVNAKSVRCRPCVEATGNTTAQQAVPMPAKAAEGLRFYDLTGVENSYEQDNVVYFFRDYVERSRTTLFHFCGGCN